MPHPVGALARPRPIAAAPTWLPTDEASLIGWFDASATASITSSSGLVSQIDDKSGLAHHMVQATGANQFTTGTRTVNGRNVLDSTNTSRLMKSSTFTITECMFFVVLQFDVAGGNVLAGFESSTSGNNERIYLSVSGAYGRDRDQNAIGGLGSEKPFPTSASTTAIQTIGAAFRTSTNPDQVLPFRQGSFSAATNVTESTFSSANRMLFGGPSGDGFDGVFCEGVWFNAYSTAVAANWYAYVQSKWGVA